MKSTEWLKQRGWDKESDSVHVYIGPRGDYNALQVKGKGYTLDDAISQAIQKEGLVQCSHVEGDPCGHAPCMNHPAEACFFTSKDPADVAIHMVDAHGMDADEATVWLRKQVEGRAFSEVA